VHEDAFNASLLNTAIKTSSMAELFQDKFRIPSARLQTWDYGSPGFYFITICTQKHFHYFGSIVKTKDDANLQASPIGQFAEDAWFKTPVLRPDMNIELGEFIVMPNHVHGIIMIGGNKYNRKMQNWAPNAFGPQKHNIASILKGYKASVTNYAKKLGKEFGWQPRYYDHIIRSQKSFEHISNYIINNPNNWQKDMFHGP
jgi:REP element-mobilizing transposase RayT